MTQPTTNETNGNAAAPEAPKPFTIKTGLYEPAVAEIRKLQEEAFKEEFEEAKADGVDISAEAPDFKFDDLFEVDAFADAKGRRWELGALTPINPALITAAIYDNGDGLARVLCVSTKSASEKKPVPHMILLVRYDYLESHVLLEGLKAALVEEAMGDDDDD